MQASQQHLIQRSWRAARAYLVALMAGLALGGAVVYAAAALAQPSYTVPQICVTTSGHQRCMDAQTFRNRANAAVQVFNRRIAQTNAQMRAMQP